MCCTPCCLHCSLYTLYIIHPTLFTQYPMHYIFCAVVQKQYTRWTIHNISYTTHYKYIMYNALDTIIHRTLNITHYISMYTMQYTERTTHYYILYTTHHTLYMYTIHSTMYTHTAPYTIILLCTTHDSLCTLLPHPARRT